ncbi:MAG TPA: hypothetical protein PKK94_16945, partial [Leptospiraceae bacterium]|nr:hypothetical protein [Leptospiraceae bacterium]
TIRDEIDSPVILFRSDQQKKYEPESYHYDQLFSFLICEKLDFDFVNLVNEFDSIYKGIKVTHRHNMILSINDGLFLYYDKNAKTMMYPFHNNAKLLNRIVKPESDKYCFLKLFSSYMFLGTSSTTILYPELSQYMGSISGGLNIDEKS